VTGTSVIKDHPDFIKGISNCGISPDDDGIVTIPSWRKIIPQQYFFGCDKLRAVYFEKGSVLRKISYGAFAHTHSLQTISLPPSLELIGEGAFYDSAIEEVVLLGGDDRSDRVDRPDYYQLDFVWDAFGKNSLKTINIPTDSRIYHSNVFSNREIFREWSTGCLDQSIFVSGARIIDCKEYDLFAHYKERRGISTPKPGNMCALQEFRAKKVCAKANRYGYIDGKVCGKICLAIRCADEPGCVGFLWDHKEQKGKPLARIVSVTKNKKSNYSVFKYNRL